MNAALLLPWLALLWPLWLRRRPEAERPLWMRRSLLLLLSALCGHYLLWRLSASLNLTSPLAGSLSVLLLLAEALLLLSGLLPLLLAWRRFSDGRPEAEAAQRRWQAGRWRPWVDVLIPTCGEPLPVLERCLLGCSQLSYPRRTLWLLDDAGRPELAVLAARHGCRYHHRPLRRHAKAGNLNAGLALGAGELVAVFDADFVPQQAFLERTIGLLEEPRVALVQTPQQFLNADPVMRNLQMEAWLLPDEESFYRWIQPVRGAWRAVVCAAGTRLGGRRTALLEIGGFAEEAISEDLVTGMALAARGWQLRYLGEPLSAGLAAESMLDFVRQRQRWASGTLQALRLARGPVRLRGLSWGQRLAYAEGALHWFNTVPRLVLLLMPLAIGLLGVVPLQLSAAAIASRLLPLWLALLLSVGWLNRGSRHALLADLPGWALAVPLAGTVLASLVGRVQPFRITPKHRRNSPGGIAPVLAIPLLALLLLNGVNLLLLGQRVLGGSAEGSALGAAWLGLLWSGLSELGLLVALRACWDPPAADPTPWLALHLPAQLTAIGPGGGRLELPVHTTALSELGAVLQGLEALPTGSRSLTLHLCPARTGRPLPPLPVQADGSRPDQVLWSPQAPEARAALQRWLYGRPGAWPQRQAPPEWRALAALLQRLLTPPGGRPHRSLVPQQLGPDPHTHAAENHSVQSPVSAS